MTHLSRAVFLAILGFKPTSVALTELNSTYTNKEVYLLLVHQHISIYFGTALKHSKDVKLKDSCEAEESLM